MKTVYFEFDLEVDYWYQPAEPPERGPEAQYPGCGESVEVTAVCLNSVDILEHLSNDQIKKIEDDILEQIHDEQKNRY